MLRVVFIHIQLESPSVSIWSFNGVIDMTSAPTSGQAHVVTVGGALIVKEKGYGGQGILGSVDMVVASLEHFPVFDSIHQRKGNRTNRDNVSENEHKQII